MKAKKRALLGCVGLLLAAGEAVLGQSPADLSTARSVTTIPASTQSTQSIQSATVVMDNGAVLQPVSHHCCQPAQVSCDPCNTGCRRGPKLWASFEYLHWWLKDADTPALVTTGDPNLLAIGQTPPRALGNPSTRVLFGGDNAISHDGFSGGRLTLGAWLNDDWGVEVSGFMTETRSQFFSVSSNANGVPAIYIPIQNFNPNSFGAQTLGLPTPHEGTIVVSESNFDPALGAGIITGGVSVEAETSFWGAEINAIRKIVSGPRVNVNAIVGFRYVELEDELRFNGFSINGPQGGIGFDVNYAFQESFSTRNQFYGGQIGGVVSMTSGRFSVDGLAKIALGSNRQLVSIAGTSQAAGAGVPNPGAFNVGEVFTYPSNVGREERNEFAVIPQVQLKLGYNVTDNVRLTAAYDFIYWSDVVRAGDQIDRRVNGSQGPAFGGGAGLVGANVPQRLFQTTDFFAHGVSLGVELKY